MSEPPLPIALIMTSFEPGGTERQMIELARRLDPRRWTVHIACTRASGAWFPHAAEAAASVRTFPISGFRRVGTLRQMGALAAWLRDRRVAVAHATDLYANIFGLPAAALARVPARIANRREINPDKSAGHILMQRAAYGCAHRVVANSQAAARRLRLERVPARRIRVIPNGLEASRFEVGPREVPPRRVVVVANLRPEKGHDVLVDAAPAVLARFPAVRFAVVGDGPERAALQQRAERRGVASCFSFEGHCHDVPARLRDADLFVLPSRSEAFPNSVLEAMAAGLPVVASDVGGIPELVAGGATGLLVPPGDAGALAGTLCRLIADPMLAAGLGAAARDRVRSQYSFDRMVAAFEQVYVDALAERGAAAADAPRGMTAPFPSES